MAKQLLEKSRPSLFWSLLELSHALQDLFCWRCLLRALSIGRVSLGLTASCGWSFLSSLFSACSFLCALSLFFTSLLGKPIILCSVLLIFASLGIFELFLPLPFLENIVDLIGEDKIQGRHYHLLWII